MRGPVGYDQPDDADGPPDKPSDRPGRRSQPETRNLEEYYADLRAAVALEERTESAACSESGAQPEAAVEPPENDHRAQLATSWEENAEVSRWMWSEYKRRWPPEERQPVDRSEDQPGSWYGEGNRVLNPIDNQRIEAECDRIAAREREKITPAMRAIESQDRDRHLVGLQDCLKGRDRIKEKVAKNIAEKGLSPEGAISRVPDTIRFTFQYDEARYTRSVQEDIARMKEQGFKLEIRKNSWLSDQYKGINSQWIEPDTGQRVEVQFHTRISFEAKQITHLAYERLRTLKADKFEEMVLEAFQKKVAAEVPVPPGAADIPDYPERDRDAR
jgi:hypothetical protein